MKTLITKYRRIAGIAALAALAALLTGRQVTAAVDMFRKVLRSPSVGVTRGQTLRVNLVHPGTVAATFPHLIVVKDSKGTPLKRWVGDPTVGDPSVGDPTGLRPGQRYDLLYRVSPNTRQIVVVLSDVTPALPPAEQNQLFGDDILLTIHSPKTSSIGDGDCGW